MQRWTHLAKVGASMTICTWKKERKGFLFDSKEDSSTIIKNIRGLLRGSISVSIITYSSIIRKQVFICRNQPSLIFEVVLEIRLSWLPSF
uniref:Uncharacterized protein n=1 Tax=Physcomitrium patens TaxID=3218 RepID=A0A2K1IYH0_PHYPA|nr:hypothetical protein PHYPA_024131 [Physcomitrium patens]